MTLMQINIQSTGYMWFSPQIYGNSDKKIVETLPHQRTSLDKLIIVWGPVSFIHFIYSDPIAPCFSNTNIYDFRVMGSVLLI